MSYQLEVGARSVEGCFRGLPRRRPCGTLCQPSEGALTPSAGLVALRAGAPGRRARHRPVRQPDPGREIRLQQRGIQHHAP